MSFYFVPAQPSDSLPSIAAPLRFDYGPYLRDYLCKWIPTDTHQELCQSGWTCRTCLRGSGAERSLAICPAQSFDWTTALLCREKAADMSLITSRMFSLGFPVLYSWRWWYKTFVYMALNQQIKLTTSFAAYGTWCAPTALLSIIFLPGHKSSWRKLKHSPTGRSG